MPSQVTFSGFPASLLSVYDILYAGDFVAVRYWWEKSIHCRILSLISMVYLENDTFCCINHRNREVYCNVLSLEKYSYVS